MIEIPIPIRVRRYVCPLIRVHLQIVEFEDPHMDIRLAPDLQCTLHALLGKDDLPVVVAQGREVAVIREIKELLARALSD